MDSLSVHPQSAPVGSFGFVLLPAVALASATLSLFLALLLREAPRAGRYAINGPFRGMGASAALYSALGITHTMGVSERADVWVALAQIPCAAAFLLYLFRYSELELGEGPPWLWLGLRGSALVGSVLYDLPGVGLTGHANIAHLPWLGVNSATAEQTPIGRVAVVLLCLPLGIVFMRFAAATRRGTPGARTHLVATAVLVVAASADALTSGGFIEAPQFIPTGFTVMLLVMARELARRWREDAAALDRLRESLEQQVAERGAALAEARLRLARTERLALVGRLAGAMAHQINNPVAALTGNVEYLLTSLRRGDVPADADASLEDVLESARRVSQTARELLVLSRTASSEQSGDTFLPSEVVDGAIAEAEVGAARSGWIRKELADGTPLPGSGQLLRRLLLELFSSAAPTATADRPVRVSGEVRDTSLHLRVTFDGAWLSRLQSREDLFLSSDANGDLQPIVVALNLLRLTGAKVDVRDGNEVAIEIRGHTS